MYAGKCVGLTFHWKNGARGGSRTDHAVESEQVAVSTVIHSIAALA